MLETRIMYLVASLGILLLSCAKSEEVEKWKMPTEVQTIEGTGFEAKILIDKNGLPTILAKKYEDCMFALGYIMAKMRYAQIDSLRIISNGLVSTLIDVDEARIVDAMTLRTLLNLKTGKLVTETQWELLRNYAPTSANLFSAFIEGMNFYIKSLEEGKEELPPEYKIIPLSLRDPTKNENKGKFYFTPPQILAIARFEEWYLTGEGDLASERIRTKIKNKVGNDIFNRVFSDILTAKAGVNIFTLPSPALQNTNYQNQIFYPSRGNTYKSNIHPNLAGIIYFSLDLIGGGKTYGSNNWVISATLTSGGFPIVANDPHLPLFNPPLWFPWKGIIGDMKFEGFALVGIPGILTGTNGKVAWGITNAGFDSLDLYLEEIEEDTSCKSGFSFTHRKDDGSKDTKCVLSSEFKIGSGNKTTIKIYYCEKHGVILGEKDKVIEGNIPVEPTLKPGYFLTFRWNGHETSQEVLKFFDIMTSDNLDDFMQSITEFEVAPINYVFADLKGDIGYGTFALLPERGWDKTKYPPTEVLPTTGCCDWEKWVDKSKFPHVKNPPKGFIVTANNDLPGYTEDGDPFGDPVYLFWSYDPGYRIAEITYMIQEKIRIKGKLDVNDMKDIHEDTISYFTRGALPFFLSKLKNKQMSDVEREALSLLEKWDMTCKSGYKLVDPIELSFEEVNLTEVRNNSAACTIFWVFISKLIENTFSDEFSFYGVPMLPMLEDYFLKNIYFHAIGEKTLKSFDYVFTDTVESDEEIISRSFSSAVSFLKGELGSDTSSWFWGKIAKMKLYHFLSLSGLSIFDVGPFPIDLGPVSPAVAWVNLVGDPKSSFVMTGGPSMRWVAFPGDDGKFKLIFAFPGGVAGYGKDGLKKPDPTSYFINLLPTYFGEEYVEFTTDFQKGIEILP